ncbi:transporter substrate-binding domain-containing protein [Rahnella aquatilis]|nr:transporter substrate-binding domain-containing protein [Rahnella aquatilis]
MSVNLLLSHITSRNFQLAREVNMKTILMSAMIIFCAFFSNDPLFAKTSPLRIAFVKGNLAQASLNPATNRYEGVSADVANEFGRRLARPIEIIAISPQEILSAVEAGTVDIGFVAPNSQRVGQSLFSKPYMLVQQTVIVKGNATIASVKELDQPGNVIGAYKGDSISLFLSQTLKHATVKESTDMSMDEGLSWIRSGSVVAFAGNRQRLGELIKDKIDLALLPDNLHQVPQAIAVSREAPDFLAKLESYLADMKATGFLDSSVRNSGVNGIIVAR